MSQLLQRMLEKAGKDPKTYAPTGKTGKLMRRIGVQHTPELDRIISLGVNTRSDEEVVALQELITASYKTPEGEQEVWPIQATALADLHDYRGLVAGLAVASGKTLISYLAPLIMEVERPLLLIPAHLRGKTYHDFDKLAQHWKRHPNTSILSYTEISRIEGEEKLARINPDMIIGDEVHHLKNRRASCTKKVEAWMGANPETIFVGMSGTITTRSILDYWHLLRWALGKENMPLPAKLSEAEVWALALDEKIPPLARFEPGELRRLAPGEPPDVVSLPKARELYGERLRSAPGVIITQSSGCGVPIYMETFTPEPHPQQVDAIVELSELGLLPNGDEVADGAELWRRLRELALGFYSTWDPEPPAEWKAIRKEWKAFVRRTLFPNGMKQLWERAEQVSRGDNEAKDGSPWHSEEEVRLAVRHGLLPGGEPILEAWDEVRPTFKPNSVPNWITDTIIEQILNKTYKEPTVIWADRVCVGERLAEIGGYAYFQRKGLDAKGRLIDTVDGKETVVASVAATSEGHNLQGWSRSLVSCPSPQGAVWEQKIGRHDREGQKDDEIRFRVLMTEELTGCMYQAIADARYQQATTGSPQKLLQAQLTNEEYDFPLGPSGPK